MATVSKWKVVKRVGLNQMKGRVAKKKYSFYTIRLQSCFHFTTVWLDMSIVSHFALFWTIYAMWKITIFLSSHSVKGLLSFVVVTIK